MVYTTSYKKDNNDPTQSETVKSIANKQYKSIQITKNNITMTPNSILFRFLKLIAITTIVYWTADPIVTILDNTALFFKIYPRLWTIPDNDYANLHLLQFSVIFLYAWGLEFKSERYQMKLISPITAFGIYYLVILTFGGSGHIGSWDFSNRVPALIYPIIAIITYELIFEKLLRSLQNYSKTLLQKNTI